ncbi:MAG: alpha/beta hydrolase [Planctomycetota bacterium]
MNQHNLMVNGIELACHTAGEGLPLVLIHGFPFDHTMWAPQIETLSSRCQVIAPDLRGYGASKMGTTDSSDGVDMATYAQDVAAWLDEFEVREPVILCGFSMGGYILWQFAKRHPERIRALILCDTRTVADSPEASAGRRKMAESIEDTGVEPVVEGLVPKLLATDTLANRPEIVQQVSEMIRQASPAAIASAQRGMAAREDVSAELDSFDWPALVVVGEEDAISPAEEMRGIAKSLPQGQFCEIAGAGHMTALENPVAVNDAMQRFIELV